MTTNDNRRYLVVGATGAQGGAIARRLLSEGRRVVGLTRAASGARPLPDGVTPVTCDLAEPSDTKAAFAGATHAAVQLPTAIDPSTAARFIDNIIAGATAAGLRRLVFNASARIPAVPTGVDVFETLRAAMEAFLASEVPTVVLQPGVYLENLCAPWVAGEAVRHGNLRYPLPESHRGSWASHGDLAAAVAAALVRDGLDGRVIDLDGAAVTGPELATELGAVLGRPVRYAALDPGEFERGLAKAIGEAAAARVAATYRWLGAHGDDAATGTSNLPAVDALGVTPTSLRTWVAAQPWLELA